MGAESVLLEKKNAGHTVSIYGDSNATQNLDVYVRLEFGAA
jgi:hypothetical protein